jgi:hypothetical protein
LCEEAIEIIEVRYIALYAGDISSDLPHRRGKLSVAAASHENVRAFADEPLRRGESDTAVAAGDESDLSVQLTHRYLP